METTGRRIGDYEIVAEQRPFCLLRRADGRGTVIQIDRERGQVYNAMPGDAPRGGGSWYARISQAGVDYVASFYSWRYARRMFRQLVREYDTLFVE